MHASWFSYNISKPYPFKWFTPVVIVGTIVFTVLFSAINLAANGYYLTTIYTTTPNETISKDYWFNKAPWSWGGKFRPTCQPQNIPIGYQFFTSSLGLSYTLQSVSRFDATKSETVRLPSLTYFNQTLQNCQVDSVVIDIKKSDQSRNGEGEWWSWADSTATSVAHCTLLTATGPVNATFSTIYDSGPKAYDYVIRNNYTESSSMWWGTRLLNLYWSSIQYEMAFSLFPDVNNENWTATPVWTKGQMTFKPNKTNDIKAYDFFHLDFFFIAADSSIRNYVETNLTYMYNNIDELAYTGPLTEGLSWAKVMYSTILTDLGQTTLPNLLQDENLLQWILQYPDDKVRQSLDPYTCPIPGDCALYDWINYGGIAPPNAADPGERELQKPMNQSYVAYKDMLGPLGTKNTTIFTQYACSIPVKKGAGSLFLAVLIADLVFLQVLWSLLNLIAGSVVSRHDAQAMACRSHADGGAYGMIGRGTENLEYLSESQTKLVDSRRYP